MKKKLCFFSPNAYPLIANTDDNSFGGAEVKQVLVAKALSELGYSVSFITYDFDGAGEAVHEKIRVLKMLSRDKYESKGGFYKCIPSIWSCMKYVNADIYFQRAASPITGIMALFCRLSKKKFIYAAASSYDVDGSYSKQAFKRARFLYELGLKKSDKILVQASEFREKLLNNYGLQSLYIRDGHPIPETVAPIKGRECVIFIGGMRPVKRPELFIELAKRFPDKKFVMIGGPLGDERYFRKIKRSAEEGGNINFMGHVRRDNIGKYLTKAIALVNTSEREGLPNTVTEAWSHGVPVIGLNINPDNLLDGKLGLFCKDNFGIMVESLKDMFENETVYARMSDDCRRYAADNHDIKKVVKEYVKVIESV